MTAMVAPPRLPSFHDMYDEEEGDITSSTDPVKVSQLHAMIKQQVLDPNPNRIPNPKP